MTDRANESRDSNPAPDTYPDLAANPIARAWGRTFLVGAAIILAISSAIIVRLASDSWRAAFMPLCVMPVYGWAYFLNARRIGLVRVLARLTRLLT
ncbi:hypothetical protein [Actinacidiphila rubida]|uniref:Uncharacterized protein n=1 Tax=Actinacidiphila rubida TaxID=310780 RepID=A0A1H8NHG6_9ACTN|nr:hypothetical protein [Actinacidiphila rubida]SEO29070.1 hypothetical protein SAMN05216267_102261 [Actinacidiphila rubida]